jgi:small subunit ribosomal protein S16
LARTGRKKIARYRIVAADSRSPRGGRFLETLGDYNPQRSPKQFTIKTDRIAYWLQKGAVPSVTVKNLLKQDRFAQKYEAVSRGLSPDQAGIERKDERKRKAKKKKTKSS